VSGVGGLAGLGGGPRRGAGCPAPSRAVAAGPTRADAPQSTPNRALRLRQRSLPRAQPLPFPRVTPSEPYPPRTASYEADPAEVRRVLLLYSGGLDTSVMLKWIGEHYDAEVVCLTVNLGQPGEDYTVIEDKARRLGALECHVVDARERFAREFLVPAIKANAVYGDYPLFTALGRPLIAALAVEYARLSGCDTIAHGCTGKGNDQVRIEATIATLGPELRVIAPVRSWQMGREEELAYAREHGIPIKTAPGSGVEGGAPYSIDDNLWGRSSEGRWIEDLSHAPDPDVFQLVTRPELAPDEPETVTLEFERGVPVALNGERLPLVELIETAAAFGARHGVGIVDHIEDRIVGLKVRDIYETPAAALILPAHRELERLVCTIHQNQFKPTLERQWAYLVYAGLWWEPLRADLDAYMDSVNAQVSGTIGLQLYKGHVRVVTRESPHAVYDAALASFATSGGLFSQAASPGFIELFSLQSRLAHRLREQQ
jgi:argininosuccinate synthase